MNRRAFLLAAAAVPRAIQSLTSEGWRIFEVATHVHVQNASGTTRVWLPTPLVGAPYQQTLGDTYNAEHGRVVMVEGDELDLLLAEWTDGAEPVLDLTSRVATRTYAVDLAKPTVEPPADFAAFARFLRATKLHPIDGAVRRLATEVTRGAGTDIDKRAPSSSGSCAARRRRAASRTRSAPIAARSSPPWPGRSVSRRECCSASAWA